LRIRCLCWHPSRGPRASATASLGPRRSGRQPREEQIAWSHRVNLFLLVLMPTTLYKDGVLVFSPIFVLNGINGITNYPSRLPFKREAPPLKNECFRAAHPFIWVRQEREFLWGPRCV